MKIPVYPLLDYLNGEIRFFSTSDDRDKFYRGTKDPQYYFMELGKSYIETEDEK